MKRYAAGGGGGTRPLVFCSRKNTQKMQTQTVTLYQNSTHLRASEAFYTGT